MRFPVKILSLVTLLLVLPGPHAVTQSRRPLELADLLAAKRISDPVLSPDGKWIAYTVTTADIRANKTVSTIYAVPATGGEARQLTTNPGNHHTAAWSPDGKSVAFVSTRSGRSQIWMVNLEGGGGGQVTTLSTGASQPVWAPDGKSIAFISEVFPEYSEEPFATSEPLNKKRLDELENGPVKAKVFSHLLFRHWDSWVDGKRKHLFVQSIDGGDPRDLTPGDRDAVPTSTTFSAGIDFAFSPDGKELAYTASPMPVQKEAWSTNHDIYVVPVTGGHPKKITTNPAADGYPRYSPGGKYIVYRAQSRTGFEADRWQLMLYDRASGRSRSLTKTFDAHAGPPLWTPDGRKIYFESEEKGNVPIFSVSTTGNDVHKIFEAGTNHNLMISPDGKTLLFAHSTATHPVELFSVGVNGKNLVQVTTANDSLFALLDIPSPEAVWYNGADGKKIQAWFFKPAGFDPSRKYPLVYLVHGGPQSAWLNGWSFRWNPALWAAQGYVIMAPNPRGSTGFGQKFINAISGDWGGKVFVDLMKGLDYAETLPYIDKDRKAAAGASFGGYMMNWFQAKAGNRFKALVTHDGVFNFESMYGTTEEVWFDEWDHGGTPWDKPEQYRKFTPHVFAKDFKIPDLIIHSELDFRVPLGEGLQLFTTLQRRGIPSKFLYFPDEGHFILKPGNSQLWHATVFEWLASYLK